MKMYKALKEFNSPLIGSLKEGDVFQFGSESIKPLLKAGLCVELNKEYKEVKKRGRKSKSDS